MALVYLVWRGEYSDKHVLRAFSSREAAEVYLGEAKGDEDAECRIEECPLDDHEGVTRLLKSYTARIAVKSGEMRSYSNCEYEEWLDGDGCRVSVGESVYQPQAIHVDSPISVEHAEKVAIEERQKYLREHASQADASPQPAQS